VSRPPGGGAEGALARECRTEYPGADEGSGTMALST